MVIKLEHLKAICPQLHKNADVFVPYLNEVILSHKIDTPKRLSAFIAQIAHESGQFRYTVEIASGRAYEGRKDLGNIYAGDGVKFKGRGLIQITGRDNYTKLSKTFGVDFVKNPDLLSTPQYAVKSAAWFWQTIKGNDYADLPDTWRSATKKYTPFQYITYRVNGGQNGYAERLSFYNKALAVFAHPVG